MLSLIITLCGTVDDWELREICTTQRSKGHWRLTIYVQENIQLLMIVYNSKGKNFIETLRLTYSSKHCLCFLIYLWRLTVCSRLSVRTACNTMALPMNVSSDNRLSTRPRGMSRHTSWLPSGSKEREPLV